MRGFIPLVFLAACNQGFDYRLHPPEVRVWPESNPKGLDDQFWTDDIIANNTEDTTVLVVIDNSVSMVDEQSRLMAYVPKLLDGLISSGRNFHFGTTVSDCDLNYPWTNDPTPCGIVDWVEGGPEYNPEETRRIATSLIDVGIMGSSIEKLLQPIHAALDKRHEENLGFFYDEGPIHILGITDEPDQTNPKREEDVIVELIELENKRGSLTVNTIIKVENTPGDPFPWLHGGTGCDATYDQDLMDLPSMFSGLIGDICADEWDLMIEELSELFVARQTAFSLSKFPVEDTIEVNVIHQGATIIPEEDTWTYDEFKNLITFNDLFPVEYLDEVVINYQVR